MGLPLLSTISAFVLPSSPPIVSEEIEKMVSLVRGEISEEDDVDSQ